MFYLTRKFIITSKIPIKKITGENISVQQKMVSDQAKPNIFFFINGTENIKNYLLSGFMKIKQFCPYFSNNNLSWNRMLFQNEIWLYMCGFIRTKKIFIFHST